MQAHIDVPHDKIKLTVKDGWIKLEGNVDWYYQKNAAEFAVKYLSGVKGITNNVKVKPQVYDRSQGQDRRRVETQCGS